MNKLLLVLLLLTGCEIMEPGIALAEPSDSKTNIVFVVDISGSMQENDKIGQARGALVKTLGKLPSDANVGILIFSGSTQWLVGIGRLNKAVAMERINRITPEGGTAIGDALTVASRALEEHKERMGAKAEGATFQVILMSDGQNTGGIHPVDAIAQVSRAKQRLDVIGVEFRDEGIKTALKTHKFENAYHEVSRATELFAAIAEVLNLETITIGTGGSGDISVLTNVPPDVLRALLQAVLAAERRSQ